MATKTLTEDEKNQGVNNAAGTTLDGAGTGGGSQTGTNWTNLSQYLDNNKGSGAGMADDITKDAQGNVNKYDGAHGAVDTWESDAKKQVDQGTRQDKYSGTIQNGSAKDVAGIDQGAYGAWKGLKNYAGPQNAATANGYNDTYSGVKNTKDQIQSLGSYDGQKAALANTYGKSGSYGTGFQNLDAFALNGDKAGQQKLGDFKAQNANFGQKFDTANNNVNSYIGGADARGQGVLDNTNKAITDRAQSIYGQGQAAQTTHADSIYNSDLDAANAKAPTNNTLTGLGGSQYVTQNRGDAQAYLDSDNLGALNNLYGIDDSADTNALSAGNKASSGLNWEALGQYAPVAGPGSIAPGSLPPGENMQQNVLPQDQWTAGGRPAGGSSVNKKTSQR